MNAAPRWIKAADRPSTGGAKVVKMEGKQILLLDTEVGLFAINNRCPHEGYPLSEGTLGHGEACPALLTCNWHNWKFDLRTGRALDGGDPVRTYPVEARGEEIWIDIADPPAEERRMRALESYRAAFEDYDYERLARELARLVRAGGHLEDGLRAAAGWSHDRDRKSTRLNSSHEIPSRMPSSA